MIKKLALLILVLFLAYYVFLPEAIQKKQEEFQAAGATNTSVLQFLDSDNYQNQ